CIVALGRFTMPDQDREALILASDLGVRHEGHIAEGPQQLVEPLGFRRTCRMQVDLVAELPRFLRETTGEHRSGAWAVVFGEVEVDLGHYCSSRYCTSRLTGRPVAPFSAPDL